MRKKSKKTVKKVATKRAAPKKLDGRTKEGRAAKAKLLSKGKRKVESASEVKVKRKYTRKPISTAPAPVVTPKASSTQTYTDQELQEAKSYFSNARNEVSSRISSVLKQTPKDEWNKYIHVDVNGSLKKLKTVVVAAALGV